MKMTQCKVFFLHFYVVFAFCSLITNAHENQSKALNITKIPLIIGGEKATEGQFPYQASILIAEGQELTHQCGGSIYNKRTILTAAHCFILENRNLKAFDIKVWVGGVDLNRIRETGQLLDANEIILENYDTATFQNDIAVIKLKQDIKFSTTVDRIELFFGEMPVGAAAKVSGWGKSSSLVFEQCCGQFEQSINLLYANLEIVDHKQCEEAYAKKVNSLKIFDTMMCTTYRDERKHICRGDSGGPLVIDGKQIGIASLGLDCASQTDPDIFTDVTKYKSWIERNGANQISPVGVIFLLVVLFKYFMYN